MRFQKKTIINILIAYFKKIYIKLKEIVEKFTEKINLTQNIN